MARTSVDFTFQEAVRSMGVTPERLEKLIEEGQIEAYQEGIDTFIPRRSIVEYLAANNGIVKRQQKKGA
jgi:hypothetical protein